MWRILLVAVIIGLVVEMAHSLLSSSTNPFFNDWVHDAVVLGCAVACAGSTRYRPNKPARWCLALGIFSLFIGEVVWGVLYLDDVDVPYPNAASPFYLAAYPLFMAGLILVVRRRMTRFELHRWLDGLVIVLIVATPMFALVLEPVLEDAPTGFLGQLVVLSYPIGDLILLGALLGAVPLMGWRVDAAWCWLAVGLICFTVPDSIYAVQSIRETYHEGPLDFLWAAGCVATAVAAWMPAKALPPPQEIYGWPAIALPLGAQVFAVATQIYAFFYELPNTERLLTVCILGIGIAQIIVSRPRLPRQRRRPAINQSEDQERAVRDPPVDAP